MTMRTFKVGDRVTMRLGRGKDVGEVVAIVPPNGDATFAFHQWYQYASWAGKYEAKFDDAPKDYETYLIAVKPTRDLTKPSKVCRPWPMGIQLTKDEPKIEHV